MRTTAEAPRRSSGDVLGLAFFLLASAGVMIALTGVDVLGRAMPGEGALLSAASAPCPANAD